MPPRVSFGISVCLAFVAWGIVAWRYIWPALRDTPRGDALRPILLLHGLRFRPRVRATGRRLAGLACRFRRSGCVRRPRHGDPGVRAGVPAEQARDRPAWVFNVVATADLLDAAYRGTRAGVGLAPGLRVPPTSSLHPDRPGLAAPRHAR